jgi:hypothetical protein
MPVSSFLKKIQPLLLIIILAVGMGGLVSVSCGGDKTDPTDTSAIKKYDRSKKVLNQDTEPGDGDANIQINNEQVVKARQILKQVSLSPKKIRADSAVAIEVEMAAPLEENQYLAYVFWKNGKPLEETKEAILPPLSCKKNDGLFADVLLYENDRLIARKRSDMYLVLNSPPEIEEVTLPDIKGPGTYKFIVKAKDADNDQLTFSLEMDNENPGDEAAPIPLVDAQIDAASGEVTCTLDENLPDSFKFTITADDGDGGIAKKIVSMRFFKRPVNR